MKKVLILAIFSSFIQCYSSGLSKKGNETKKDVAIKVDTNRMNAGRWRSIDLWAQDTKNHSLVLYEYMLDSVVAKIYGHGLYFLKVKGKFVEVVKEIRLTNDNKIMVILENPIYRNNKLVSHYFLYASRLYNCYDYDEETKNVCEKEAVEVEKWREIMKWDEIIPEILKNSLEKKEEKNEKQ